MEAERDQLLTLNQAQVVKWGWGLLPQLGGGTVAQGIHGGALPLC